MSDELAPCWCGCDVDDDGRHLSLPPTENAWSGTYFHREDDGTVHHERDKPSRALSHAPSPEMGK